MQPVGFDGIFGLLVYSAVLYVILQKAYGRVREKYQNLLKVTNELAEGNLDVEITEDLIETANERWYGQYRDRTGRAVRR